MKKVIALSLSALLAVCLFAGCSPASSGSSSTAGSDSAAQTVEISLLNSKPEITDALEAAAEQYAKETGVSITVYETDAPGDYMTEAYASGDPTTMALVDYANVKDFSAEYLLDMSAEEWGKDGGEASGAYFDGKLYGFPFAVEARGIIYNKTVLDELLGEEFDPAQYATRSAFEGLLATLREKGMQDGIVLNADDWSIGSHYLQTMYSLYDGTMEGGYEFTRQLTSGELSIADSDAYNEAFDTLDMLMEYNYNKADPLAADYDMNASYCADGTVAFWLNGTFAWPDFSEFAEDGVEYGVMPLPVSEESAGLGKLSAGATKYIAIDKAYATEEQQQAALDFLNWLVYTEEGNDLMVNQCGIVPAFSNITLEMNNPFNISLQQYIAAGNTICAFSDLPSDHRSALAGEMQKYIAGEISRADLAALLDEYWQAQA